MAAIEKLDVTLAGLGAVLSSRRVAVPPYQRLYAWTGEHTSALFKDLNDAIRNKDREYFLGTVVITKDPTGRQWVIDGQQRLTTTSILLASIRDYFLENGDQERADIIQREHLSKKDLETLEDTPYIKLNDTDHDFYLNRILARPGASRTAVTADTPSQVLLAKAADAAQQFIARQASSTNAPSQLLMEWVKFIREKAKVIVVEVANEANAFTIFEVLNDRGLDLTVADLLKNFLFKHAGDRLNEAQSAWVSMTSMLEALGEKNVLKTFIRHAWASKYGLTREKDLYDEIRKNITSKGSAIALLKELDQKSRFYSALKNPGHELWKEYGGLVIQSVEALDILRASQIRPLLISVFSHFEKGEVRKALPMLVSWTVRFTIVGSTGSGPLEDNYSRRAKEITEGQITTASQLWEAMKHIVPSDDNFKRAFEQATVSTQYLARYYLRVLNAVLSDETDELVVNPSEEKVTLEHIMPQSPLSGWAHIDEAEQKAYVRRIGNLTLLDKKLNEKAGNIPFAEKKGTFSQSSIFITKKITEYDDWSPQVIEKRQKELAEAAVSAWSPKPSS
jgi:hypothetical protein